jgi:signal transduction histidine kinase
MVAGVSPPPAWTKTEELGSLARELLDWQEPYLTSPMDTPWAEDVMLLTVPVYDESGATYGILVGPMSIQSLNLAKMLSHVQVGQQGAVYLVDGSGQILDRTPTEWARSTLAGHTGLSVALSDGDAGTTLCHAPDGKQMTLAYAPVDFPHQAWRVIIEQPWSEVIGPVLRYSQFMPLVAALAVVVSVLTLYYGVRAIVLPLQTLGQRAEQVAWGDFGATATPVGGVEEIEDLRRTLDQMARRIQSYQSGMHDYIAAITRGQEEERTRLARELHDDTAQALIALGQRVEMAQKLLPKDPHRAAERLTQVRTMLAETVEGVRRFSRDLRPIYLEDLGFIPALEMLARKADQQETLSVHLATTGMVRRLPPDLELAAYRIVQEALNNVIQHAQATHAWVEIRFGVEYLILSVRDDGRGFEPPDLPDALARQGHFGLMGIQERTLLYGGQLTIHSSPGNGTEITVRLSYPS